MALKQKIQLLYSQSIAQDKAAAILALNGVTFYKGMPAVSFYGDSSKPSVVLAVGTADNKSGEGSYEIIASYADLQTALNALDTVQGDVTKLKTDLGNLTTKVGTVEGKANQNASDIEDLQGDVEDLQSDVETAQNDITNIKSDITGLKTADQNATKALEDHKKVIAGEELGHVKNGGNVVVDSEGKMSVDLSAYAPLASPDFSGTPTAPTAQAGTNTTQIATTAFVKAAIDANVAAVNALSFKGVLTGSVSLPTSDVKAGDVWIVGNGFTSQVAGENVEEGDMVVALDSTPKWNVIQKNIDGAVTGPTGSVVGNIAVFNSTTGKIIKDSEVSLDKLAKSETKVEAGTGLKGGGAISADVTISHQDKPTTGTKTGEDGKYISAVTVDSLGHIASVETEDLPTESGKVKVAGTDAAADYLGAQFATAAPTADNTLPVAFSVGTTSKKVEATVVISEICGGTF